MAGISHKLFPAFFYHGISAMQQLLKFIIFVMLAVSSMQVSSATYTYYYDASGYCDAGLQFASAQEAGNCSCQASNGTNALAVTDGQQPQVQCVEPWWRNLSREEITCLDTEEYNYTTKQCEPVPEEPTQCTAGSEFNSQYTQAATDIPSTLCPSGCEYVLQTGACGANPNTTGPDDAYYCEVTYISTTNTCTVETGTGGTGTGDTGTGDTGTGDTGTGDTGTGDTGTGDTGTGGSGTGDTGTGTGDETDTQETYPSVPAADNDQYSSMLDGIYDDWTTTFGNDDPGIPNYTNPLNLPAGGSCSQLSFGIGSYMTTFPGSKGCSIMHSLQNILEWAVWIMTAYAVYWIALKKPAG